MSDHEAPTAALEIEHVGGIDRREIEFDPGVTLLAGENATNRTSTLRAITAVCGSDQASLKASADEGHVHLTIHSESYTRRLIDADSGVRFDGDPYLQDATAADLFAFLLGDNDTRRAVVTGAEDLREIVMDPVDVEAIEQELSELRSDLDAVEEQLDRREHLRTERLPKLRAERDRLDDELQTVTTELAEKRAALEAADENVAESKARREAVESTVTDLQNAQSDRQDVLAEIEAERAALETARERLADVESKLDAIDVPDADREHLQRRRQSLWDEKEQLDEQIDQLQTLIGFNETLSAGEASVLDAIAAAVDGEDREGDRVEHLTSQLSGSDSESLVCWTCGQAAERRQIDETLETLREYQRSLYEERDGIDEEIEGVEAQLDRLDDQRARRERLIEQRDTTEREIDRIERTIDSLETRREELADEIDRLEDELDGLESDAADFEAVIDLHRAVTEREVRKQSLERDRESVTEDIESVESELQDLADLEEREKQLRAEIEERRTRIERLEAATIEAFNDHMDALLDRLEFENVERVWIERKRRTERDGRRTVERSVFDLHVVRSAADGTVFEDAVANLSESERNVVALVFALAGYLAHEVYEQVPFMLLDSLEMIDATRKARLLAYFSEYPTYLVAVVLADELDPLLAAFDPDDVIDV